MNTRTARRGPSYLGVSGWAAILGSSQPATQLEQDLHLDVAIVGGGFAGLAAARRLKQINPDAKIAILEAVGIAEGASGRNSGFMIDLPHVLTSDDYAGEVATADAETIQLNRLAIEFNKGAVDEYRIPPAYFDPCGKINGARSEASVAHNKSYAEHLGRMGERCELLDAKMMREITGSDYYRSGLFTPGTVMLQPAGFVRGLCAGLKESGIQIYERTVVSEMRRVAGKWVLFAGGKHVVCDKVILATNGHLESFGFARRRLMHIILYASMTRDINEAEIGELGGNPRWGITPADPMGSTVRRIDVPQGGNRIVIRTCASYRPDLEPQSDALLRAMRVHREQFDRRFPKLRAVGMDYSWAGNICLSLNDVSVVGEVDENLFSACCQNGLGAARGTLSGIGAAELVAGESSPISQYFKAAAEPKMLPPWPVAELGANAVIKWKEWRARNE